MNMQILVQKKDELNAEKAIEFIENCKKARLAIVHSSIKDEIISLDFFDYLVRKLKTPFVGLRVGGTATNQGYSEDSATIAVLCGDFDVKAFHEKINYEKPEETADKIISQLNGWNLCLVYSANYYKQNVFVDSILRKVQFAFPNLQIWGSGSSPSPIVATNQGIHKDTLGFVALNLSDFQFIMDSGFKFDESAEGFTITESDDYYIYEINGKNAVEEYSKIQHMRPYLINMLNNLSSRADVIKIFRILSQANEMFYLGILKIAMKPLGTALDGKTAEILFALELKDEGRSHILTQSYKPKGTLMKRLKTSPEEQLAVYDRLHKKFPKGMAMLMCSCAMRPFWFNFDFKALENKLKKFKCPFMLSYVWGEFGTYIPYKDPEQNILHGGVVKALIFK